MSELYDTFINSADEASNLRGLVDNLEEDAANYCFDKAALEELHRQEYIQCMEAADDKEGIAIACMALEKGTEYGTDGGPVQNCMYDFLFKGSDINDRKDDYSADRMTNFLYVFKMALRLLDNQSNTFVPCLPIGYTGVTKESLFTVGFPKYKTLLEHEQSEDMSIANYFDEELNRFAMNSSKLGNYCCIPKWVRGLNGLNPLKGNYVGKLYVYGVPSGKAEEFEYCVNDQFALFMT